MSEFAETALGILPRSWQIKPLGETTIKIQDGTHFSPQTDEGPCLYLTSKNIKFGRLDITDGGWISQLEHDSIYARCDVKYGDVLLTKDGANTGNACLNTLHEPFSLLSSVAFLRADGALNHAGFILQYLLSPLGQRRLKDLMSGNAIPRLTLQKIKAFKTPVPTPDEQRRIATILTTLDEEIEATEALIAKHQQIKAGLMHDLFTRGLWTQAELARGDHRGLPAEASAKEGHLRPTPEEAPGLYQDSPLGLIPRGWETRLLGDLVQFDSGYAFKNQELSESGIKVVRITNLHRPTFPYWHYDGRYPETWIVDDGDLLFSWAGVASSIDCYIYRGDRALLNQHIYNFRTKEELMKPYLFEFLQWILPKLRESIEGGAGQLHLTKGKIQGIQVLMPPIPERQGILERLQAHQSLLQTQTTHLAKLRQQKQGLMHDLLTGRVRVDGER